MTPIENWAWGFLCGVLTGCGLTIAGLAWWMSSALPDESKPDESESVHLETSPKRPASEADDERIGG